MGTLINEKDKCFFDHIASEVNKLAGITAIYYQFIEGESEIDPLYNEVIVPRFKKGSGGYIGVEIPVFFKDPDKTKIVGEEGLHTDKSSEVTIAASDLESRNLRIPRVGDIFKIWGYYWDVREYHNEGLLNDNPVSSVYVIELSRRTKMEPEGLRMA